MSNVVRLYNALRQVLLWLFNAGVFPETDFETVKRLRLLNLLLLSGSCMIVWFTYLNYSLGFYHLVVVDLLLIVTGLGAWVSHFFRGYLLSRVLLFVIFPLQFLYYPVFIGDIGTEYYQLMFIIIGFYCFSDNRILIALTAYLTAIFIFAKYRLKTGIFPEKYQVLEQIHYWPSIIASAVFIIIAIVTFKINTNWYRKHLIGAEEELNSKLKETADQAALNKSLYKELNHRVKNNLQLISGLFSMQTYEIDNPAVEKALSNVRNRIEVIANLHRHLYETSISSTLDVEIYLRELFKFSQNQLSAEYATGVVISANAFSLKTTFDTSIDLGLLLNELLAVTVQTNAKTMSICNIAINFCIAGSFIIGEILCEQSPENNTQVFETSFSYKLAQLLAEQNNGTISWSRSSDQPTIFTFDLSVEK